MMNHRHTPSRLAVAAALWALTGCYGGADFQVPGHEGSGGGSSPGAGASDEPDPAQSCGEDARLPATIRGLNSRQYVRTIESVFPGVSAVEDLFGDADRSAEFSTSAQIRRLDFKSTANVVAAAEAISNRAIDGVTGRFTCLEQVSPSAECVEDFVDQISSELYRAPASAEHRASLHALFDDARARADSHRAIEVVLRAMLTSPRFLFRTELGQPTHEGEIELTPFEVASALSYTLSDAPPDAELQAAARAGELHSAEQISDHAARILAEQAGSQVGSQAGFVAFVSELTGVRDFDLVRKDEAEYPGFDEATKTELVRDFEATTAALMSSDAPTLERMLTGDEFVVSPASARLLGWDDPEQYSAQDGLVAVDEDGRVGLLTHPTMLATYAHEAETNPIARGHFVAHKLLCTEIPPPPQAVSFPERDEANADETLRETLERIHSVDTCAGCHSLMDPYGWPFEAFDAVGRRRDTDRGRPIDDSSEIVVPGEFEGTVNDVTELLDVIASSEVAHRCVGGHAFQYVTGLGPETEGAECISDTLATPFADDGNLPEHFVRILASRSFLRRRTEP